MMGWRDVAARLPHSGSTAPNNGLGALYAARAVREIGDGFAAVLLPVYLTSIGMGVLEIGIVATAALLGSALMTLTIGLTGAKVGARRLLLAASALMVATGFAFAVSGSFWVILPVAFLGTMNPSAGSVSIFAPLEQSVLAGAVADGDRTRVFARYGLIGALAAACGALASTSADALSVLGISKIAALRTMFVVYAALGLAAGLLYARVPEAPIPAVARPVSALGPSRRIVYVLAGLFSIDAFAGGFVVQSLIALWLFNKFSMSLSAAGLFFFWTGILGAFSFPVAAWLAKRIGLVNTMVWTHIPSSIVLILAAVVPDLWMALTLLLVRAALSQMDVPTRNSYVMAVVTVAERPAAASLTSVPRSLAAASGPALAGALFASGYSALPFIICGVLKIIYDLALLWAFRHVKPPEEQLAG